MDRFELDKPTIENLFSLYKKGRLTLDPIYQRGRVWNNEQRYALIDSILQVFPIGLIMLNVVEHVEEGDESKIDYFDVVDGQQRMRTIFEYIDGEDWAVYEKKEDFKPFKKLTPAVQTRFCEYKVSVAFMKSFQPEEIIECYNRLQKGKTLKIGEKLKSLVTYDAHKYVKDLTKHKIFDIDSSHKIRDSHWTLSTAFFKSIYKDDLLGRQEYKHLEDFLKGHIDEKRAVKALDESKRILFYENKVLEEALRVDPLFIKYVQTARTLKWLFVCISNLTSKYSTSGREHLVANGLLNYYKLISSESDTGEWKAYVNSGRTGRIDTSEVRACLVDLTNQIILAAILEPLDPKRYFSQEARMLIYKNSRGRCKKCSIELSPTNFHADHIKPYSESGPTSVGNGQALCSACNHKKGASWKVLFERES